jgi:hypothetical protein
MKTFDDWFNSLEGFAFRSEYFYGDVETPDEQKRKNSMYLWLKASYDQGVEDSSKYQ